MMEFRFDEISNSDYLTLASILIPPSVAIAVYCVGVYFHTKVIKISVKEKDMTWKLDVTNSLILMIYFGYFLFMKILTFFVQDLFKYTGDWFCYFCRGVNYYGSFYIAAHTLVVAIKKYIVIVHWDWAMEFGHDKISKIFFFINFLHPTLMISFLFFVRKDFLVAWDGSAQEIDRCLGDPKGNLDPSRNHSLTKLHDLCEMDQPSMEAYLEFTSYLLKTCVCWTHISIFYVVRINFFEVVFYALIFRFMRK